MDFNKFFSSSEDLAALMVITPFSIICLETDVHEEAARKIYKELYGEVLDTDDYFAFSFNDRNAVCLQLMNKDFIIVNIPNDINDYQYEKLKSFNDMVKSLNNEIEIHTNIFDGNSHLNLSDALLFFNKEKIK